MLEHEGGRRFGQITDLTNQAADVQVPDADGAAFSVRINLAIGHGLLLDQGSPFHGAAVRPAVPAEVAAWLDGTRRADRARLMIGELLLAPGVPAELDSGGLNRHTFMCGQSGSGKTYSLGLLLERVLAETTLRIVILDPNSDHVGLGRLRDGADPTSAQRYRDVTGDVAVWSNEPGGDHPLRLRFAELVTRTQGAVLGLDPIADRGEYAVLTDLLRSNEDGQPLITGLDQLTESSNPSAHQLGMRAINLGVLDWTVWSHEQPSLLRELREPTSRCVVVDLGSLETLEEQRMVADAVLASLWSLRRSREPVLVVVDEAHNICAAEPEDAVSRISTERTVQIAAEGRKYGLYLLVSTQRPNKVHENVVSQCDNLLLMRMNSMADVADLSRLFSFVPPGLLAGAPSFGLGQALTTGRIFPQGRGLRADGRPGLTGRLRRRPDHVGAGQDVVVDDLLVIAGIALLVLDYVIKFLAIGVLPGNRKPSSAMAWLILILIIPFAGFVLFLLLGRTNLGKGRLARQHDADDVIRAATERLPTSSVDGPAYLGSMATLSYNLGSLPIQTGNLIDLIPDYHGAIAAMTAEVTVATSTVEVEFYISGWDNVTAPFFEALVAAAERGVDVRLLFDHMGSRGIPGYAEFEKRLGRSDIDWRPMLPVRPLKGQVQRPDLRNHRKILVVDGRVAFMGSQNLIEPGYNKPKNHAAGREWVELVARIDGPTVGALRAVFAKDWYTETHERMGEEIARTLLRHREQPSALHGSDLRRRRPGSP